MRSKPPQVSIAAPVRDIHTSSSPNFLVSITCASREEIGAGKINGFTRQIKYAAIKTDEFRNGSTEDRVSS